MIRFHHGAGGRRQPALVGTRLYVYQIISTLWASGGDIDDAASYLVLAPRQVRAALDYYADFGDEVDADAAAAARVEQVERARWELPLGLRHFAPRRRSVEPSSTREVV